jgi:hypothetical protein
MQRVAGGVSVNSGAEEKRGMEYTCFFSLSNKKIAVFVAFRH